MNYKLLAALAAASLTLVACGSQSSGAEAPQPAVTVTETETVTRPAPEPEPEPQDDVQGDDATYLAFLASKGVVADPDTTIEVGKQVCETLDAGHDVQTLMALAVGSGFTSDQAAAIIAAAIVTYCPWNEVKVTG